MLLRFDPFRELDRVTEQVTRAPLPLPMDAVRRDDDVLVAFDLPGVDPDSIDLTVERNVLTVKAERAGFWRDGDQAVASERWIGTVTRELMLGDTLDGESIEADYTDGVLTLTIAAAEQAKARRVSVGTGGKQQAIKADATENSDNNEKVSNAA